MNATGIEWTDYSASLLKYRDAKGKVVWHCEKVSPGCRGCYAEAIAERFNKGGPFKPAVTPTVTPFFDEAEAAKILRSKKPAGRRVFVDDMSDLFGEWVPDDIIDRHFAVFALRPDVVFQVLTKRPERMAEYTDRSPYLPSGVSREIETLGGDESITARGGRWPLPNVWLGTSVEDQRRADERITKLLQAPAAVHFLSCEPLLGPVNLRAIPIAQPSDWTIDSLTGVADHGPKVNWVIVGGESGPDSRPMQVEWARSIVQQCKAAGTPAFVKQLGANVVTHGCTAPGEHWPDHKWAGDLVTLSGGQSCGWRVRIRDRKGGDPSEWPEDLRVRQFPTSAATGG